MFFSECSHINLISVLDLEWTENNTNVLPRNYHALSYRLIGNAVLSDANHTVITKNKDLLYMPAGAPYHIKSQNEHIIVIHFELLNGNDSSFKSFFPSNAPVFEKFFTELLSIWNKKMPGYYFRALALIYKIFEQMTRQFSSHYTEPSYQKIKSSAEFVHLHFKETQLNIEQLCELSGLSDTQFRKLFFNVYETTPLQYINQLRVEYAADLLNGSFFTIEEIALKSGFSDPKYFSTVFKKYMNCPPSKYKML